MIGFILGTVLGFIFGFIVCSALVIGDKDD